MLTTTTRRCKGCGTLLSEDAVGCPNCSSIPCPLVEAWPADAAAWLTAMELALYLRPVLQYTRQQRAEFLLRGVVTGHQWGEKIVPMSATAVECLPIAVREAEKWCAAGKPREAETMITLARVR